MTSELTKTSLALDSAALAQSVKVSVLLFLGNYQSKLLSLYNGCAYCTSDVAIASRLIYRSSKASCSAQHFFLCLGHGALNIQAFRTLALGVCIMHYDDSGSAHVRSLLP